MRWLKHRSTGSAHHEPELPAFTQCAACSYNFMTGEGTKNCSWYACPYLPEAYDVFCPACNFNFFTREGARGCEDLATCRFAAEGFHRAGALRRHFAHPH